MTSIRAGAQNIQRENKQKGSGGPFRKVKFERSGGKEEFATGEHIWEAKTKGGGSLDKGSKGRVKQNT